MNFRVVTEPQAEDDITEAYLWIAERAPMNAVRWERGLEQAINSLETFPNRCAIAPESETFLMEIRQLLYGNYRILFTIQERTVHVLHVRHGAREYLSPDDSPEE